ncbi:type II secretion system F family protein [Candidatus Microgenomates bacterium]|nr:type II secretion system F family protein [Candidatus Microgenomates bacterium]
MDRYSYEAKDKMGKLVKGLVEADSFDAVDDILRYNKLTALSIRPYMSSEDRIKNYFRSVVAKIRPKDKAIFARQLATMINAGLPLMEALRSLLKQTPNKNLVAVILKIISMIEKGKSFSYAIAQFPFVFSPVFVSMVKSGEASGKMDKVLLDLAEQLESDYALRSKIRGAMIYPAFILSAMLVVGVFAIVYIIPSLEEVFTGAGAKLPATTYFLIALSHALSNFWYLFVLGIIIIIAFLRYLMSTNTGKTFLGYMAMKIPVFGKINLGIYIAHFARNLGLLMAGGVPIVKSLSMVSESVGNILIEREIKDYVMQVEQGIPLSEPVAKSKYFPTLVASMVAVGEQTGQMDKILINLANIYEEETNNTLKGLTSLLEPVIMLIIGLGVAFLVVSIIMPIFQLSNVF